MPNKSVKAVRATPPINHKYRYRRNQRKSAGNRNTINIIPVPRMNQPICRRPNPGANLQIVNTPQPPSSNPTGRRYGSRRGRAFCNDLRKAIATTIHTGKNERCCQYNPRASDVLVLTAGAMNNAMDNRQRKLNARPNSKASRRSLSSIWLRKITLDKNT